MDLLKKPGVKKRILIVAIIIILIIVLGFATKSLWFPKVSCILPNYDLAGTEINKSYPDKYLVLGEWQNYEEPEVQFFFSQQAQDFLNSKISALKGYGGLSYKVFNKNLSVHKGYYGNDCQPLRYKYKIALTASLSGIDLSAALFGRWYYKDLYEIEAVYRPDNKKWEEVNVVLKEKKLIPGNTLTSVLELAKKSEQYQKILKEKYKISEVYWTPKGDSKNSKNDTIILVYSKPVGGEENLTDYFIIEIDDFNKVIVSEKTERK